MKYKKYLLIILSILVFSSILGKVVMSLNKNDSLEWGARASEAFMTNYKNGNNVNFGIFLVNSPVNQNLKTFYLNNNRQILLMLGHGTTGPWGRGDVPIGGESSKRELPAFLHLTYSEDFSDKFYQLNNADIPKNTINEIFNNINKGLMDEDGKFPTRAQYNFFETAIAPNGWVTLFAVGPGIRKEVISWQAQEIDPDFNETVGLNFTQDEKLLAQKNLREELHNNYWDEIKDLKSLEVYKLLKNKDIEISSKWFKQMQTRYPWNLEVSFPDIFEPWNGEYYAEYSNTERFPILDDQLEMDRTRTKPIPIKIVTWAIHKETRLRYWIEIHTLPIPKWSAEYYIPYYQDPNLIYLSKRFSYLYPNLNYETNNTIIQPDDFSKLYLSFNEDLILQNAELIKGKDKLQLDGAYQYYLAPIDVRRGKYLAEDGHPRFLTEPKTKDLSDPIFVDIN